MENFYMGEITPDGNVIKCSSYCTSNICGTGGLYTIKTTVCSDGETSQTSYSCSC